MLLTIPNELLISIAEILNPGSLMNLLQTCRACNNVLSHVMIRHALAKKDGIHALRWAAMKNHVPLLKTVVQHTPPSAEAANDELSALFNACTYGNLESAEFLLDHGVPHTQSIIHGSPLAHAVLGRHLAVVRLLLSRGATPNTWLYSEEQPIMFDLCRRGWDDILRVLLAAGANPNVRNYHMSSCLTLAAEYGYLECVKALVEHGAEVDVMDMDNDTPLILALNRNKMDVVDFLMERDDCDFVSANNNGYDPLMLACRIGRVDILEKLFSKRVLGDDGFWYEHRLVPLLLMAKMTNELEVADLLEQEMLRLWLVGSTL